MNSKIITATAVAAVGVAAFVAGRSSAPSSEEQTVSEIESSESRAGSGRSSSASQESARSSGRGDGKSGGGTDRSATREQRLAKLESIMRGEDPLARSRALLDYLDGLDPAEMEEAVARFRSLGMTEQRFGEYAMMLTAWAKIDPTAALTYARENTDGRFSINTILSSWAINDPGAAIAWAKANHSGDGANAYMVGIIRGIASSDPDFANSLMTEMPMSRERGDALSGILPHYLAQGLDATKEWIASIGDDSLRAGAIDRAASQMAAKDPKGTADWLLANPGEGASRNMDNVIEAWMSKDAASATAYYQTLPQGEARSNALRGIISNMAQENPQAAAAFIDQHPGDVNDRVVTQFAWSALDREPTLALEYIGKMAAPDARDGMYRRAINAWMRNDEQGARNYLQNNPLPQSMQGYVQQRLGQ